jgi:hypothetical protein
MLGYIALLFSLPDYAISIELSRRQATQIAAFLNLGTVFGRLFIRVANDRLGRIEITSVLTLVCGWCYFVIWLPSASFGVTVLFVFVSGAVLRGLLGGKCTSTDVSVCYITLTFCCFQKMGPLCAEVAVLKQVASLLSLSWLAPALLTACTYER